MRYRLGDMGRLFTATRRCATTVCLPAALLLSSAAGSCVDEWATDASGRPEVRIEYIGPDTVVVGTQFPLAASVTVGDAALSAPRVVWRSLDPGVLAVDSLAALGSGRGLGVATIEAVLLDPAAPGPPAVAQFNVTVVDSAASPVAAK